MKYPWQIYETREWCRWCGGTRMHTRNDLAEHPDDVGRMSPCHICDERGEVPAGMTLAQYAAKARGVWTGNMAYDSEWLDTLGQEGDKP